MIVDIPIKDGDNKKYLTAVNSLIATLVKERAPKDLQVTRINKWFDHKWLKYSGKGRVAYDCYPISDTSLDPLWKDKLTFPPFNPRQIGQQIHWERQDNGTYGSSKKEPKWVHKHRLQSSAGNLNNRVADFTESGLFVWFTSNTDKNMHGSILVYLVDGDEVMAWYASFKQQTEWIVDKTKGIEKNIVEKWFPIK